MQEEHVDGHEGDQYEREQVMQREKPTESRAINTVAGSEPGYEVGAY